MLQFDLVGGPVAGTATGEEVSNTPSCTFDVRTELTFSGTFDPVLRKLSGTVDTKLTSTVTRGPLEVCRPGVKSPSAVEVGGSKGEPWEATLSADGQVVTGRLLNSGGVDTTFVLRVE